MGEDDTGFNEDDILADGCAPYTGPGAYTISGEGGFATVTVYNFGQRRSASMACSAPGDASLAKEASPP